MVEIEIMGQKAKIESIRAKLASPSLSSLFIRTKDSLSVWLNLYEPVDGTTGFGIIIPVKNYGKEELLEIIRMYAENELKMIEELKEEREQREARERDLNGLGEQLLKMLSR